VRQDPDPGTMNERDALGQYLDYLEETARHAGHADLLREAIDGAVGE
jgi:hypothetical protein